MALFMAVDPVCDFMGALVEVAGTTAFAGASAGLTPEAVTPPAPSAVVPVRLVEAERRGEVAP
jgi:hypothetical protein